MQTIKGLAALLLVAVVVFVVMAMNAMRSQAKYAAQMNSPNAVEMAGDNAAGSTKPATAAPDKSGKLAKTAGESEP